MALVKLTETHFINPDIIGEIIFMPTIGGPHVEIHYLDPHRAPNELLGEEAAEAWTNWKAHADQAKD